MELKVLFKMFYSSHCFSHFISSYPVKVQGVQAIAWFISARALVMTVNSASDLAELLHNPFTLQSSNSTAEQTFIAAGKLSIILTYFLV